MIPFQRARRMEDLALFTRHVSGAMTARAPLPVILRAYVQESDSGRLKRAVSVMADRIESGVEFSAAMDDHPRVFPAAYRRLARLGEQGRVLGGIMSRLADSLEQNLRSHELFRRAAVYPILLLFVLFGSVAFVTVTISPKFEAIFHDLGMEPVGFFASQEKTALIYGGINLLLLISLFFLIAIGMGLRVRFLDLSRFTLSLPLIGPLMRQAETSRFATYLALLLENQIPLSEALGLLADSSDNSYLRAAIQDFHERFQRGERLSDLLATQPVFPPSMAAMVAVAEDQGGLAETLRNLGRFYNDRAGHELEVMRELYEPLMLVFAGIVVISVLYSIYYPLFSLPQIIGR